MKTEIKNCSHNRQIKGELAFNKVVASSKQESVFLKTDVSKCFYQYPLKLMLPKHASDTHCQWVYPVVFGGGLVGGDQVSIDTNVGSQCCVLFTTQSFPKVYGNSGKGPCTQKLNFKVEAKAFLAVLSDPVVCYKDAIFHQEQNVYLSHGSNLVYLDWFTAGRTARGEIWAFDSLHSSLSVFLENQQIFKESLELSNTPEITIKDAMGNYAVVGVCVLIGPFLQTLSKSLVSELNQRKGFDGKISKDLLFTASPLYKSTINDQNETIGCVLRIAACSTSLAYKELDRLLEPLNAVFGDNPFENKF